MKRSLLFTIVLALGLAQTACLVRTRHHHRPAHKQARCHPSHYWDGHHCRHKSNKHKHKHHRH